MLKIFLVTLIHVCLLLSVCSGFSRFDLLSEIGMDKRDLSKYKDVKLVEGPTVRIGKKEQKTEAFNFGPNAENIELDSSSNKFSYILWTLSNSDDVTFAVHFKLTQKPKSDKEDDDTLVTLLSFKDLKRSKTLLSISLKFIRGGGSGVEGAGVISGTRHVVEILQTSSIIKKLKSTNINLPEGSIKWPENGKPSEWQTLMVRVKNKEDITVYVDCNVAGTGKMKEGKLGPFLLKGRMTMAYSADYQDDDSLKYRHRYIGDMYGPQILNGAQAFDYYNPCSATKTSSIANEPNVKQYDHTTWDRYQSMISSGNKPINIFCKAKDNAVRVSGETWEIANCYLGSCENGEIKETYNYHDTEYCKLCYGKYKDGEKWRKAEDPCTVYTCDGSERGDDMVTSRVTKCKSLSCKFGEITPSGKCCPVCKESTCTNKEFTYGKGCKRKCTDGREFKCPEEKEGCWCKKGEALNQHDQCKPVQACDCKVETKFYKPGQLVRRSQCKQCVCMNGVMECISSCDS